MKKLILDKAHHRLCDFWCKRECSCDINEQIDKDHFTSPIVSETYEVPQEEIDRNTMGAMAVAQKSPRKEVGDIDVDKEYIGINITSEE